MRLLFLWGALFVGGFALVAFLAPATSGAGAFGVLITLSFIIAYAAQSLLEPKWYLRRGGRESGPLTLREIGALQHSGQLGEDPEIRGR